MEEISQERVGGFGRVRVRIGCNLRGWQKSSLGVGSSVKNLFSHFLQLLGTKHSRQKSKSVQRSRGRKVPGIFKRLM